MILNVLSWGFDSAIFLQFYIAKKSRAPKKHLKTDCSEKIKNVLIFLIIPTFWHKILPVICKTKINKKKKTEKHFSTHKIFNNKKISKTLAALHLKFITLLIR